MVDSVTYSAVEYRVQRNDVVTDAVITGYEVTRFGVPMIGQYINTYRGRTVTIRPAVPDAKYRITVWALGGGRRSTTPAVVDATTGEAGECDMLHIHNFPQKGLAWLGCCIIYENWANYTSPHLRP